MTVCKNESDPKRTDKYGRDGYTACCTKSSCQERIGTQAFFKVKIGVLSLTHDEIVNNQKYQDLSCYSCGDKKGEEKMTICVNATDPERYDDKGKDAITACCTKEQCQNQVGSKKHYDVKLGPFSDNQIIEEYQSLQCYVCGDTKNGEMTICTNVKDPERNDEKGKEGFTACCTKSSCLNKIGKMDYFKVEKGKPEQMDKEEA